MISDSDAIRNEVIKFCSIIGADPMLVQGAGGNISWKDDNTLWVKASGTWLSDSKADNIFVPVELNDLKAAIKEGNFNIIPKVIGETLLRPSIETLLHALLDFRVVVHVHAIEALTLLVRNDPIEEISKKLKNNIPWVLVDYKKPGFDLARAISNKINDNLGVQIIFLQNHGIVIGGSNVSEVNNILFNLVSELSIEPTFNKTLIKIPNPISLKYIPVDNLETHNLALIPELFNRLNADWALYPDHVVFLGPKPNCYDTVETFLEHLEKGASPELVFLKDLGVFSLPGFSKAKQLQLKCYHDVLVRQKYDIRLKVLNEQEISELLNWEAEKYRKSIEK